MVNWHYLIASIILVNCICKLSQYICTIIFLFFIYIYYAFVGVMQLFVKTPTGKVVALEVEYTDSIKTLKSKIHEKEGTPPDEQQLTFYGRLLEDSYTMSHYRLRNESTVHLVSKPRGEIITCILS